jgi:hypothetical protein
VSDVKFLFFPDSAMRTGIFPSGTLCHIEIINSNFSIRQMGCKRGYSLRTMCGCNKIVLNSMAKDSQIVKLRRSKLLCKKTLALLSASRQFLGSKIGPVQRDQCCGSGSGIWWWVKNQD